MVCIQKHNLINTCFRRKLALMLPLAYPVAGVQAGRENEKSEAFMQAEGGWLAPIHAQIQLLLGLIRHALPIQVPFHLLLLPESVKWRPEG